MPAAARRDLQLERLRETVRWATDRVAFYREKVAGTTIDRLDDLGGLPFTRKTDLREHYPFGLFAVPRGEIVDEGYDLSFSRYKENVFEEVRYDAPGVILDRLLQTEVGDVDEADLAKVQSGIVRDLLELKGMVG